MGKQFSTAQDDWLREHHSPDKFIRQLTEEYNAYWGESRSSDVIKGHCKRLGLKQSFGRVFTKEQDTWLQDNTPTMSYKETTARFNEIFDTNRSVGSIKVHCNRDLRVHFRNQKFVNGKPIGSERIHSGYVWVKVSDEHSGRNSFYKNWRQKAHVVWEQHYGSLPPKDHRIVFLDRNPQNCDINNLYAVDGRVNREMSKKSWWNTDPELTLAAIKWCELFYAIKDVKT